MWRMAGLSTTSPPSSVPAGVRRPPGAEAETVGERHDVLVVEGLLQIVHGPSFMARTAVSTVAYAVTMATAVSRERRSARRSVPLRSGSLRSTKAQSMCALRAISRASDPEAAVITM